MATPTLQYFNFFDYSMEVVEKAMEIDVLIEQYNGMATPTLQSVFLSSIIVEKPMEQ